MKVAVLGASPKPDRYSNRAVRLLKEHGHDVIPVNPGHADIEEVPAVASLSDLSSGSVDTLTVYVNSKRSSALADEISDLSPRRVIFNPGAENQDLTDRLAGEGVEVEQACTLVLLNSGQFE